MFLFSHFLLEGIYRYGYKMLMPYAHSMIQVPTAEGLVVRVLSSIDKKLEVKPKFLELFQEGNYPKDFSYKSKV